MRRFSIVCAVLLCSWMSFGETVQKEVKIGFLVKQPEEPWFQDEWSWAAKAAKAKHFTLIKIGVPSPDKVLSALRTLGTERAQGVIICSPNVRLGTAIRMAAKRNHLKLMSVDDRLVDGQGHPITSIPHMGISAYLIGQQVGRTIADEMKKRGWTLKDVGVLRVSYNQLPTAKARTDGATDILLKRGIPKAHIFDSPEKRTDTEAAFTAARATLTKNQKIKHWVAYGLNDEAALGAVRASEGFGMTAAHMIAVGIGGSQSALNEFSKGTPTGFFATVRLSAKRHGYETSVNMYNWITQGKRPPSLTLTSGHVMFR